MPRKEINYKRTENSKTFLNDDGSYTTEIGGGHAHYQENGIWKETKCEIGSLSAEETDKDTGAKFGFGIAFHPFKIRLNANFIQPMMINDLIIRPLAAKPKIGNISADKHSITYLQPWDGIDVTRTIVPEGIIEEFKITSTAGQRVLTWILIKGDINIIKPPVWLIINQADPSNNQGGEVPFSVSGNQFSFDLTNVPIGAVIY